MENQKEYKTLAEACEGLENKIKKLDKAENRLKFALITSFSFMFGMLIVIIYAAFQYDYAINAVKNQMNENTNNIHYIDSTLR